MLNWAVGREYIERTPSKRGSRTLIKKLREDNKRRRRIDEAEEAALLGVATPHIQAMLVAAVDTGMRQGEMLALRFDDVDLERGLITLRGETTKSRKTRVVPISTERLRAVIEWLRLDADGDEKPEEALVFSNEAGEPLRLFHRTWVSLVLRAHGLTPTWAPRMNYQGLSDAPRTPSAGSTCGGTTCGTSTPHGWSSTACRGPKCATSSATRRSRRPSATTTRRSPTSRSPPPSSNAGTPSHPPCGQGFKILSRSRCPMRGQAHRGPCLQSRLTSWRI